MILSKQIIKNSMKGIKISGLVGLCTLVITGGFIHNDLYAATTTPATYSISELTSTLYRAVPTGYVKPSYTFNITDKSEQATANDLSPADAAEIMSQELYRCIKADISGQTIDLSYRAGSRAFKSSWHGVLKTDPLCTIIVNIDSITGELNFINVKPIKPITSINHFVYETYWEDHENDFKRNLEANCKKVQDLIATSDCLSEKIESVTYKGCNGLMYTEGVEGKEKPTGVEISHEFNVTTVSGKVYKFRTSEDLKSISSIETPESMAQLNAAIAATKSSNN